MPPLPLIVTNLLLVLHTNLALPLAWTAAPDPAVVGYSVYWGTSDNEYPASTGVGLVTNFFLTLPRGQRTYVVVRSYNVYGTESTNSNRIYYPGDEVLDFSGSNLQYQADFTGTNWCSVSSPYSVTNPTGSGYFRSTDIKGPKASRRSFFGY